MDHPRTLRYLVQLWGIFIGFTVFIWWDRPPLVIFRDGVFLTRGIAGFATCAASHDTWRSRRGDDDFHSPWFWFGWIHSRMTANCKQCQWFIGNHEASSSFRTMNAHDWLLVVSPVNPLWDLQSPRSTWIETKKNRTRGLIEATMWSCTCNCQIF